MNWTQLTSLTVSLHLNLVLHELDSINQFDCHQDFMYIGRIKLTDDVVARKYSIVRNDMKLADCILRCRRHGYRCRSLNIFTYDHNTFYCWISEALPVKDEVKFPPSYETTYLFVDGCFPDTDTFLWAVNFSQPIDVASSCDRPIITENVIVSFVNRSATQYETFPNGAQLLSRCKTVGGFLLSGENIVECRDGLWSTELPVCSRINYSSHYANLLLYYGVKRPNSKDITDCGEQNDFCSITDIGVLQIKRNSHIYLYCYKWYQKPTYFGNSVKGVTSKVFSDGEGRYIYFRQIAPKHSGTYTCRNYYKETSFEILVI